MSVYVIVLPGRGIIRMDPFAHDRAGFSSLLFLFFLNYFFHSLLWYRVIDVKFNVKISLKFTDVFLS